MENLLGPLAALGFFLIPTMLLFLVILFSAMRSFSFDLRPAEIPEKGYEKVLEDLEADARTLEGLGFEKVDRFFFKVSKGCVIFVFKHKVEPIIIDIQHFGVVNQRKIKVCNLLSFYPEEAVLQTSSSIRTAGAPRPEKAMIQIFEEAPFDRLLEEHRKGMEFLRGRGLEPVDVPGSGFRDIMIKKTREQRARVKGLPLWPLQVTGWIITRPGAKYARPIEESVKDGLIRIPKV